MFSSIEKNLRGDILDNVNNKRETIAALQNLFGEMTSSRTKLKPILAEIVKALDDNLFVDADSDEVHDLLEEIIDIQSQFAAVDEIKGAVSSKSVDKIEAALRNMEIKNSISELKIVLNRFSELQCRAENDDELAAANRLVFLAKKLLARGERIGAEEFINEGLKFEYISNIIRARKKPSSAEIAKVHEMFSDITLAYLLMDRSLSFASDAAEEGSEKVSPLETFRELIRKSDIDAEKLFVNEADFEFEEREIKKRLSSRAFQIRLKDFIKGKEADFRNTLRTLLDKRVELLSNLEEMQSPHDIEPLIFEQLYKLQVADKFSWQGQPFYYINDYGCEMLTKTLPDVKFGSKKAPKPGLTYWLRKFVVMNVLDLFHLNQSRFTLESDVTQFRFRVRTRQAVYYAVSLMLFESNWLEQLSITIMHLKNEATEGYKVRALLLCTTLNGAQLTPWFRLFDEAGVSNVFAVRLDGKISGSDGEEYEIAELCKYIDDNEFDVFEDYRKKYIKRRRKRRKKNDDGGGEPPKSKATGDRKKPTTPKDEPPKAQPDNSSTISLFSPPASNLQYSFDSTEYEATLKKKSEALNEGAKEEPPAPIEEPTPIEEPAPIEEELPNLVDVSTKHVIEEQDVVTDQTKTYCYTNK